MERDECFATWHTTCTLVPPPGSVAVRVQTWGSAAPEKWHFAARRTAMRTLSKAAAAVLVAILAQPSLLQADPLVVRSGSVRFDAGDPSILEFRGDGFDIFGLFASVATTGALRCVNMPCEAGTLVDLSTVFGGPLVGFDLGQGLATINGVQYGGPGEGDVFLTGTLTFDAPAVAIPEGGEPILSVTAPFIFSGRVLGSIESPAVMPLFDLTLTGSGRANMGLNLVDGTYQFVAASYTFADPVPEPATLLLVGTGAAALALRRRRLRRA